MQRLTILATGLYGHALPNQDGAPLRLVVPWKYGFKSIKAIVKIELTDKQPDTFWNDYRSQRIWFLLERQPERGPPALVAGHRAAHRRTRPPPTLMFNGYNDEVASLYTGMDLRNNY